MQRVRGIELIDSSGEELLAGFSAEFAYLASRAELDHYPSCGAPWHWHRPVELFYIESGTLEYTTPNETRVFPAGSGGFIGSNVLHASRVLPSQEETVTLIHLFAPELLSGGADTRIHEKYIRPLPDAAANGRERHADRLRVRSGVEQLLRQALPRALWMHPGAIPPDGTIVI